MLGTETAKQPQGLLFVRVLSLEPQKSALTSSEEWQEGVIEEPQSQYITDFRSNPEDIKKVPFKMISNKLCAQRGWCAWCVFEKYFLKTGCNQKIAFCYLQFRGITQYFRQ